MTRDELVRTFAALGADDPAGWANSQIDEGIPQLHRFVFLRQAWQGVVDPDSEHWIANLQRDPLAQVAINRILDAGAAPSDLGLIIRAMQRDVLFSLCHQLENPGGIEPEVDDVSWGLFVTDANGDPVEPLPMLHESVIETDPMASGEKA